MDTNQITPFEFHGNDVRALTDEHGDPWFIAKDICDVLGTDTKDLRAILDADEIANLDTIEVHRTAQMNHTVTMGHELLCHTNTLKRPPNARTHNT